ncbi:MAG: ion channel [Hyphomonas sp.]|nr:ion channel [Hyphomonas sp.]
MLLLNLIVAGALVAITFAIHFAGLVGLSALIRRRDMPHVSLSTVVGQGLAIFFILLSLFAIHSVEIWVFTLAYLALGAFPDVETAVYFSTSTFSTVGYGDVLIDKDWRMLAAAESVIGFLLLGWSTAFLVSVSARVRTFEAHIEQLDDKD